MKNIVIREWYGRLGNNIIQVKNALHVALHYNYNVILPPHPYFTITFISLGTERSTEAVTDESNFFYPDKIKNVDISIFNENVSSIQSTLRDIFRIKTLNVLGERDVVIHVRGGDIFSQRPHKGYIMPPLSYYVNILNKHNYDNIYLISQDRRNPVIGKLLSLYPKIKFEVGTLDKDITTILSSKNVIESFGTFTPSLLFLSRNIEFIEKPSYQIQPLIADTQVSIHNTELGSYREDMYPWRNTTAQQKIMLEF